MKKRLRISQKAMLAKRKCYSTHSQQHYLTFDTQMSESIPFILLTRIFVLLSLQLSALLVAHMARN